MSFRHFWHRTTCGLRNMFWAPVVFTVLVVAIVPAAVVTSRAHAQSTVGVQWNTIATDRGDHLPDFSFCGYHASDDPLPSNSSVSANILLAEGGDQTARIQNALNSVASAGGGVVVLGPGEFALSAQGLVVPSGVVLRGSGVGQTLLKCGKLDKAPLVSLGSNDTSSDGVLPFLVANIVDRYIPIGTAQLTVDNATGFVAGQNVFVQRTVTDEWVRANGMADLVLDGKQQTWLKSGLVVKQPRKIKSVSDSTISLDVPLTDALDTTNNLMQASIVAYNPPTNASEIGIEDLSITLSPTCSGAVLGTACDNPAVSFGPWTVDSWARNLEITGFNSFVEVQYNASRLTVQDVAMYRDANAKDAGNTDSALSADVLIQGTQVLVADCSQRGLASARSFSVMTGSLVPGPNAVLRHSAPSDDQIIFPHQRWAHGLLVEDTSSSVRLINRATNGTGHGWAINAGVGWNLRGTTLIQSPPLGVNWCIGCSGKIDNRSNGTFLQTGQAVEPRSLFAAQLQARRG